MLRTGEEYLGALRDGRQVYIGSELVTDVTQHPAFANTARSFAKLYDLKRSEAFIDKTSFEEDGERHSAWWLLPKTKDDLFLRESAHRHVANWTHGLMGRSPDHVASYLAGMCMQSEVFDGKPGGYVEHLLAFHREAQFRDLFVCYFVLSPQTSRKPSRDGVSYPSLRVVAQDEEGVTVRGIKSLGTSAVFADEAFVGCMMPLGAGQEDEAITFSMPIATPGVKIFVRKSYEQQAANNKVDAYFSSQFDESDAVMTCDDVKVPWRRVFVNGNIELSRDIYFKTPAHIMGNHQANARFLAKFRMLNGLAHKAVHSGGLLELPPIQQTLGNLAAGEAMIEALISSQIHNSETLPNGYVHINRRYLYSTLLWCANNYSTLVEDVRTLLGAAPFLMPADSSILEAGAIGELFDQEWVTPGADSKSRYRFARLVWDFLGSEFAGRQTQYERFYGGPPHIMGLYNYLQCPWNDRQAVVNSILAEMAEY